MVYLFIKHAGFPYWIMILCKKANIFCSDTEAGKWQRRHLGPAVFDVADL